MAATEKFEPNFHHMSALFQEVLQTVNLGMVVFDSELRMQYWNEQYRQLWEYPEALMRPGLTMIEILRDQARRGGVPVNASGGEFAGYRGTITDETAAVNACVQADAAQLNLINVRGDMHHFARISDMGQFASAIAHEINQPLAAITNYLRTITRLSTSPDEKISALIEKTLEQSDRASQIIKRMRQYMTRGELELQEHHIGEVINEGVNLALIGVMRDINIQTNIDSNLPTMLVDRIQLQQVMVNFVRNAIDAMEDGEEKKMVVSAVRNGDQVKVSVQDNGKGVAPEFLNRLFEPFATTKKGGMGFGLSICRTVVEAHGGTTAASPNPHVGMTFSLQIPITDDTQ